MALGTRYDNPIIERSRTNGRSILFDVPPRACTIVIGGTAETYTDQRTALGDYSLVRSATGGAETDYFVIPLDYAGWKSSETPDAGKGEIVRGFLATSVRFRYRVGVVDATSITADLVKASFTNGAAITVDSNDTIAVATAATLTQHATNIYQAVYTLTIAPTPQNDNPLLEVAVVLANTGTFTFYGATVLGTLLL